MTPHESELHSLLQTTLEWYRHYERRRDELPVRPHDLEERITSFIEPTLTNDGVGAAAALDEALERIAPAMANLATRDFSLVIGASTSAASVGDVLTTLWDQCVILHSYNSMAPAVEVQAGKLLLDLFDLPRDAFEGTFTTGCSASNLVALACARQWIGRQRGVDIAEQGLRVLPEITTFGGAPHSSIYKAAAELGLGRTSVQRITTLPGTLLVDPDALDAAMSRQDGPCIVVAAAGEVNTGGFEDLERIADICEARGAWFHVDAAFGLFARCSPRMTAMTAGIQRADSIATDLHKMLNVPYDAGFALIAARHSALLEENFSATAPYIGAGTVAPHPMNRRVENSARFRGLPTWMTLKAYGRRGYRDFIERCVNFANRLAHWIEESADYQLLTQPNFNIVLFHGRHEDGNALSVEENKRLIECINGEGTIYMTPTHCLGVAAMRLAIAKWDTNPEHIDAVERSLARGMKTFRNQQS